MTSSGAGVPRTTGEFSHAGYTTNHETLQSPTILFGMQGAAMACNPVQTPITVLALDVSNGDWRDRCLIGSVLEMEC